MTDPIDVCGVEPPYYDSNGIVSMQHISWNACMTGYKINHPTTQPPLIDRNLPLVLPTTQTTVPTQVSTTADVVSPGLIFVILFLAIMMAAAVYVVINRNMHAIKAEHSEIEKMRRDNI
jgi:acyl-CoA synthetase (AMP-forming)/AMP-acid ligase II